MPQLLKGAGKVPPDSARAGYSCVRVRAAGVHISAVMEDQQFAPRILSVHCFQTKGEEETLVSMQQRTRTPSVQEEERGRADQVTADTTITDNRS